MSHTYAILQISAAAYQEIRAKLVAADYGHAFHDGDDGEVIDMHGIAVQVEAEEGCHFCGAALVSIRAKYPRGPARKVCPGCLSDRMDLVRQYSDPDYGKAYKA